MVEYCVESTGQSLPCIRVYDKLAYALGGGMSELHRTRCQVTPGERKLMTSATERIPPEMVRVKWRGKSSPLVQ